MLNVVYWIRGAEYADMAALSAASVKRCYPAARVFVYADEPHTALKSKNIDDVFIVPAFNVTPAMLANLQTQVHYCLSKHFTAPTMFLDADILAVKPIDYLEAPDFWQKYDLVVTQRDHVKREGDKKIVGVAREMPYNYGVLMANNSVGATEAMIAMRDRVSRFGQARQDWYGNQWALREIVGGSCHDPMPRDINTASQFWSLNVRVENCDTWNYTPESVDEDISRKYFIHPKGDRKEIFQHFAKELT